MSNKNPMQRRDFLRRGSAFGVAAVGMTLGPWAKPAFASMAPPAALAGSGAPGPDLSFRGPGQTSVTIGSSEQNWAHVPFALVGRNLSGTYNLELIPPPSSLAGLQVEVTMRPAYVDFQGGAEEVHNVFVNWRIEGAVDDVATQVNMPYSLRATPADADTTPSTAVRESLVFVQSAKK